MEGKKRFNYQASTILPNNDKEWQQRKITQKSLILSHQKQERFGLNRQQSMVVLLLADRNGTGKQCRFLKKTSIQSGFIAKKLLKDWIDGVSSILD